MTTQAPVGLIILIMLSGMLSLYLAALARFRARLPGAQEMSFLMLTVALYSLGYTIELDRSDLPGILAAVRFEYLGISFIAPLMILFTVHFLTEKPPSNRLKIGVMIIPVITLLIVFTIEYHDLFYINPRLAKGQFFSILVFERGPWYFVHFINLLIAQIISVGLLFIHAVRSSHKKRRQILGVMLGALIPLVTSFIRIALPGELDPTPIGLSLTGIVMSFALFKLGLFELVPLARELALDSIRDSFLVIDQRGLLLDLNQAATRLPGANVFKLGSPLPADNKLASHLQPILAGKQEQIEFSSDPTILPIKYFQAKAYPIQPKNFGLKGTAILIRDITETAGLLFQLNQQATTDALTGLFNRHHLMLLGSQMVDAARSSKQPVGVILIDLDHFKNINDLYGHAAGDAVLRSVGVCFRKCLRSRDIIGRYGGEEFVAVLPEVDAESTYQAAERIRTQLADWLTHYEGQTLQITASLGVHALVPTNAISFEDLLKFADQALYQAKDAGRNSVSRIE